MSRDRTSVRIQQWVRPEIRALQPYASPPGVGLRKLDAMESPYGWPPELIERWLDKLRGAELNRYPDPQAPGLKDALRREMGLAPEQDLLLGNGSDEIIQMLALLVAGRGRCMMAPEPGFVMYRMVATLAGLDYVGVRLDAQFDLDVDATLAAIQTHQPALLFMALPNNPTGNLFSVERVRAVIEACEGLVVLDEAYTAFTDSDHLGFAQDYDNVLVLRTFSKVGLAGLRLGLLLGDPAWLTELEKVRLPYNINLLTQLSAEFALENFQIIRQQTAAIRSERERLHSELLSIPQLHVWPSEANFVLTRTPPGRASEVFEALKQAGLLVRLLDGSHPALTDCLRITIGEPADSDRLVATLRQLFATG
ncbi:MAG: histidinol-phosphate transaminase [Spongiibacteraceae bacterium]|jgi:histidinol-phosphate aminotransferase|nr:histidinol-phosphate transaminase [Spongiibacteraceae bacterium]